MNTGRSNIRHCQAQEHCHLLTGAAQTSPLLRRTHTVARERLLFDARTSTFATVQGQQLFSTHAVPTVEIKIRHSRSARALPLVNPGRSIAELGHLPLFKRCGLPNQAASDSPQVEVERKSGVRILNSGRSRFGTGQVMPLRRAARALITHFHSRFEAGNKPSTRRAIRLPEQAATDSPQVKSTVTIWIPGHSTIGFRV